MRDLIKLYGHLITGFGFINKHQKVAILNDIITEIVEKEEGSYYTVKSLELKLLDMENDYV